MSNAVCKSITIKILKETVIFEVTLSLLTYKSKGLQTKCFIVKYTFNIWNDGFTDAILFVGGVPVFL